MVKIRDRGTSETSSLRHCRRLARHLPLPQPWSVERLCAQVAAIRGRPIELCDREMGSDSITAALLSSDTTDYIFWRADLRGLHRDHAICHELGHLLTGHPEQSSLTAAASGVDMVTFHRDCDYGADQEQQAEVIADIIMSRAVQQLSPPDTPTRHLLRGFDDALR